MQVWSLMLIGAVEKGGVDEGGVLVLHVRPRPAVDPLDADGPQELDASGAALLPVEVVRGGRDDGAAGGRHPVLNLAAVAHRHVLRRFHHVVVNNLKMLTSLFLKSGRVSKCIKDPWKGKTRLMIGRA